MAEIQSISICCPSKGGCINHCKTCTVLQHENNYGDIYNGNHMETYRYWNDISTRLEFARDKGVDTLMITGSNEPQQDRRWLEGFYLVHKSLKNPFKSIEIQTTGALIDYDYLEFLKSIGLTTLALSLFCIDDDATNREIEGCADKNLSIESICENAQKMGINIRLCVNVTDFVTQNDNTSNVKDRVRYIFDRCVALGANQVTFRKMWAANKTCEQGKWIYENCKLSEEIISEVKEEVKANGRYLNTLTYGAKRYDYRDISLVIDEDSMAQNADNQAVKYYIVRPDGKMYSNWDSKASLIF